MLEVGDVAPDFELPATGGSPVRLSEAVKRTRATVIAFYVLDFTPGWRNELSEFRNHYQDFEANGVGVFGVSVDSVYSHGAFAKELGGLPYELIADFERKMVDAWGVRRTDMEGYDGVPRRSVFILDPEMRVRWRWITSPEQRLPDTMGVLAEAKKIGEAPAKTGRRPAARKGRAPKS